MQNDNDTKTTDTSPDGKALRSKLVVFGLPVLVWVLGTASMAAVIFFSGDKILKGGMRPALAAAFYALAPLYAVFRLGSDAVRSFKAASTLGKVGRVVALVEMASHVLIHVATVVRFATSPFKTDIDIGSALFTALISAAIGLLATLAVLVHEGAARVGSKAVRIVLYVLLGALLIALLVGYVINVVLVCNDDNYESQSNNYAPFNASRSPLQTKRDN